MRAAELARALARLELVDPSGWWWPRHGTFEVVIGAVLTQQTTWERVEVSLAHLRQLGLCDAASIAAAPVWQIAQAITPSGFYNQKAQRLHHLCRGIYESYGSYEVFRVEVSREWLLACKGVGPETADAILCYGCGREELTVDSYTARLTQALGWEPMEYDALKETLSEGILEVAEELWGGGIETARLFALIHGAVVEYMKRYKQRGGAVETAPLGIF